MKKFSSSKNNFLIGLYLFLCVFILTVIFVLPQDERKNQPPHYILIIIVLGILWILFDTKYSIREKLLYYSSGPIRGKIDIEKIRKIQHHSGWYVPTILKPALDTNGLLITYSQFDDIYVTPKEQEQFIAELIRINPSILVE